MSRSEIYFCGSTVFSQAWFMHGGHVESYMGIIWVGASIIYGILAAREDRDGSR